MSKTKVETVQEFINRGGKVNKCPTRQVRKFSSCPSLYLPKKATKKLGIDAQALLDAAVDTEHEAEAIAFLESQGYEVN